MFSQKAPVSPSINMSLLVRALLPFLYLQLEFITKFQSLVIFNQGSATEVIHRVYSYAMVCKQSFA